MKQLNLAIFLSLNGKANDAISFYQDIFNGKLLFKISNKEFKERMNPLLEIPEGKENFISHSILQIGNTQLQIADNALYPAMDFNVGTATSLSVSTQSLDEAHKILEKIQSHEGSELLKGPLENEFADFYTIIKYPYGVIIQISNERISDPSKKGSIN